MKEKRGFIILLVLLLIFVSGQTGCPREETEARKTGMDFSLAQGIDFLSAGKIIQQNEVFYVGVLIENYDLEEKTGEVCIDDNIADTFGGITKQCKNFRVKRAEIIETESFGRKQRQVKPGKTEVYFESFSYHGLPSLLKPYSAKLFVSLRYIQKTQATATITVPTPEQPIISQEPAPIIVELQKTIRRREEGYKLDLHIVLKRQPSVLIYSPDFSKENLTYFLAELPPHQLECITDKPIRGFVDIEDQKTIKCSSSVYSTTQESFPFVLTLKYGAEIKKEFSFGIDTSRN